MEICHECFRVPHVYMLFARRNQQLLCTHAFMLQMSQRKLLELMGDSPLLFRVSIRYIRFLERLLMGQLSLAPYKIHLNFGYSSLSQGTHGYLHITPV